VIWSEIGPAFLGGLVIVILCLFAYDEYMKDLSILTLIELNQKFYLDNASSFHKTRQHPWNGWDQIASMLPDPLLMAVDIGCGNGRWFGYLESDNRPQKAIGVDIDSFMLNQARHRFTRYPEFSFYQADCIQDLSKIMETLISDKASLITAFGLWHHIPSYELRLYNLHLLANRLSDRGVLCVSLWQFAQDQAYVHKLKDPSSVISQVGIESSEFEPGDYFLGWQQESSALRYCHSFSDEEINRLATDLGLPYKIIIGSGNDRTNRYLVAGLGV
jgi:tRNA (uracil-5-)-methyltransferase TRM9